MSHVEKMPGGCWHWMAFCMPSGYGNFRTPQRHELAHRSAYRLFVGPLDSRDVMHACDNPRCVNPEHLSLGSRAENMQDAKRKGRNARRETHGRSKLTEQQVDYARSAKGRQREIAAQLGVTQSHISAIKTGKAWGAPQERNYHR